MCENGDIEQVDPFLITNILGELKDLFDDVPFYLMLVDEEHHILLANDATTKALGVKLEDIYGQYCPHIVHKLDSPYPGCPLEEARKKRRPIDRDIFDNDMQRWIRSSAYPTRFHTMSGRKVYLHCVVDINEIKQQGEDFKMQYKLHQLAGTFLRLLARREPLQNILSAALDVLLAGPTFQSDPAGAVWLVEPDASGIELKVHRGLSPNTLEEWRRYPLDKAPITQLFEGSAPVINTCEEHTDGSFCASLPAHSHCCWIPLKQNEHPLGLIALVMQKGPQLHPAEEEIMPTMAQDLIWYIASTR